MDVRKFKDIVEEDEFNSWQVLMSELDSTLDRLRYIAASKLADAHELQIFNQFWNYVEENEAVAVSINDDANLYEVGDDSVLLILYRNVSERMIIFDKQDKVKVINAMENNKG